jgi:multisubunit Na+/H+ antiporter MnhG subunit
VLIWHVIISVLVYSIAHDISGGKTFGALALTFGVFLIIAVIVTIILATILFGMASTITTHPHMY